MYDQIAADDEHGQRRAQLQAGGGGVYGGLEPAPPQGDVDLVHEQIGPVLERSPFGPGRFEGLDAGQ